MKLKKRLHPLQQIRTSMLQCLLIIKRHIRSSTDIISAATAAKTGASRSRLGATCRCLARAAITGGTRRHGSRGTATSIRRHRMSLVDVEGERWRDANVGDTRAGLTSRELIEKR